MTTNRIPPEYYASDEFSYRNNKTRIIPRQNYSYVSSNNAGVITSKTKSGTYNIIEKDFGTHKVIYHVPIEYGDDYDVSQLEDIPITEEEQPQQSTNSPRLVRRRIYQQYDDSDYNDDYEYVEEVPVETIPRRRVYVSPRPQRDTQIIETIYQTRPPKKTVEYIYEDNRSDVYDYKPDNEEQVEYVVRERVPKQIYMEEPRPPRRTVYVQDPPVPLSSSRPPPPPSSPPPPPPPPPPPASYSPHRSPYQSSPRPMVNQRSPSPILTKSNRRSDLSPPSSTRKQLPTRSPSLYEPLVRPNIPKTTEPPLRLMDVIAQNRAKRGPRIPKPRREVDEAAVYDPPTYNRNVIKNGFIVHK